MAAYRCTLLDGAQQVRAVEHIECEHDVEALIRATNVLRSNSLSVFRGLVWRPHRSAATDWSTRSEPIGEVAHRSSAW